MTLIQNACRPLGWARDMADNSAERWVMPAIVVFGMLVTVSVQVWNAATDNHVTAAQVGVLTVQANDLAKTLHELADRLSAMPRPDEVADEKRHLVRIDDTFSQILDRIGKDEVLQGTIDTRVHALEAPIFRAPRDHN